MAAAVVIAVSGIPGTAWPAEKPDDGQAKPAAPPAGPPVRKFTINEFRVEGASQLSALEVEAVLLPFVGPDRGLEDVEHARAALEKVYSDKGYQSVLVAIPQQTVRQGIVTLKVTEGKVGRLRVRGARYFSVFDIKKEAPSVAEGTVPNFNDVVHDIYVLNQMPDRRVTPVIRAGDQPGTMDVDLKVEDTLPVHGSAEVNNRYSANTTHTRINGSIHYDNLWQLGHSLGFSFQIAPKRIQDAEVFAGNYLARFPGAPWLSLSFTGVIQESNVSTLGGTAVNGRGRIFGGRAIFTLPGSSTFFHSVSVGFDYKLFLEDITLGTSASSNPVHYWPVTAQYGASWLERASQTQLTVSATFNVRGISSNDELFDNKRYKASSSFAYFRGSLDRTDDVFWGMQTFVRASGQYTNAPLVGPEQMTAGGVETVRGYLEVEAVGDYGVLGTAEIRSPSLGTWLGPTVNEWRFHVFAEGGRVWIHDALPEQKVFSTLLGVGGGTRLRLFGHLNGSFEIGVPLKVAGATPLHQTRFHFRVSGEF